MDGFLGAAEAVEFGDDELVAGAGDTQRLVELASSAS
jgi:hypothetical protein